MDGIRGLPLLSGPPPHSGESEYCRKCNKEFNRLFNKGKRCNHCGYQYCGSCCNHSALMPRIGVYNGFDPVDVCSYCIEVLKVTAMGRASLRAMPLAHLKAYLNAYGLRGPAHAVEKEDYVRAVLDARQNNGCLPKVNEDYYRRHSIPQPTGDRPKGFLARMAESFSDFVDSLPQPDSSSHAPPPPPVPPRQAPRPPPRTTANRPPPATPPRPQASTSNARPAPQHPPPQSNPPPPSTQRPTPQTQRPTPQALSIEELLAMNPEGISTLSIGVLKAILQHHHVRIPQNALEKRDLVDRVVTLVEAARVEREREVRARIAEEEAELQAQRQALEEIERKKKAAAQKDDVGALEGEVPEEEAPTGVSKAAAPVAAKLERDGLCVICQDEDANIAIVDCGSSIQQQLQIQSGSAQPSPRPNGYGQNESSSPFMGIGYPPPAPSPFEWIIPTITSLLHSQHATVLAKLDEASEQQPALASKVEALQQTTGTLQQTVNAILESIQQMSDKVAKLGADMSNRDATLAERLSALDDAIESWPTDAKVANESISEVSPAGKLQTPPGSDEPVTRTQSSTQSVVQDISEQGQQLQSLNTLIQDADSLDGNNGPTQPELEDNGPSSLLSVSQTPPGLSSVQQGTSSSTRQDTKDPKTPGGGRKGTWGARITARITPTTIRRSSRQSKKRQRSDGTIEMPVSKKKAKTAPKIVPKNEARVGGKAPKKSILSQFDWQDIPIQDEELEQLIYCDKCDQAYHWGCVNIPSDDPILQADTIWSCPPCEYEDEHGPIPGRKPDPDARCRPDCPVQDHAEDMFAIDGIIGRFPHSADPSGVMMQYLVKWEDYPVQRSTWTPENEIGQAAHALIRDFEKAASSENLDVSDRSQLILLQEAREGGWGYYTFPC
ncbi:unnamed protein product [Rhizoctonia solani]|uniref:Uncharacterized protein n=1 Tax=Rhizoctonia solani TaxID=456999 RepID=A0A8H3DHS0_9AGAM|nr:unnamed protein product [Rhizoctonia solani]